MHDTASELHNELLETYDEYYHLPHSKRKKMHLKYKPKKLLKDMIIVYVWSRKEEESTDKEKSTVKEESTDLSYMPPLEGDEEEVKEEKGLKF